MADAQFAASLRQALSEDRLEAYRPENGSDLDMLTNYFGTSIWPKHSCRVCMAWS